MGIYNIKKGKELLHIEGSKDKIAHMQWSKLPNDLRFVTLGERDIKFWNPADASKRLSVKGTFGTKGKQTSMTCCTFDDEGICYSAGVNGFIMVWDQNSQLERTLKAHAGEVGALVAEAGKLISGGKDNKIVIYNNVNGNYTLDKVIEFDSSFPKAIDCFNGKLLVGLRNGTIIEIDIATEEKKTLLSSHHEGEAWGLHIIEETKQFLTIGDDNKLMLYDFDNKRYLKKGTIGKKPIDRVRAKQSTASTLSVYPPNQQGRAIAHNPVNNHVAISNNMGKVTIRSIEDLDTKLFTLKDATEWCEVIRYSPQGDMLATGSHDNAVYVYNVKNNYSLVVKFAKHNSFVTQLDWSKDQTYIRSVCGAYEKLYYNVAEKSHDPAGISNTKNVDWETNSLKIGWCVEGIYPSGEDGSHINGVDTTRDNTLIATSDDFGLMNIFRYPCLSLKHKAKSYSGHSEHVVRAIFSVDGERIFSIGGYDKTVIQWKKKAQ